MKKLTSILSLILCGASATAGASVPIMDKDGWKFSIGGFMEMDAIHDSTRSLGEIAQNSAVDRADNIKGQTGRTQFSIRNSRLAFNIEAPQTDGWKTKGYFEFDLLGFDPAPGNTTTSANNTEAGFFNSPTFRARHAYLNAESDGWTLLVGQTWNLFAWQPYYFMPTVQMAPVAGMVYARTTQFRAMKTVAASDGLTMQTALSIGRPPQRDASLPDLEAGVRFASSSRMGGFTGGASGAQKAQPLSLGLSGAFRQFRAPRDPTVAAPNGDSTAFNGYAFAANALVPVLASSDGKDVSNNLTLGGEYTFGKGYADQLGGWTGGQSNPLSNSTSATTPEKNVNLDAGQGGYDVNNNFALIKLRTWNAYLQYHLPAAAKAWLSFGYSNLSSSNILNFAAATGKMANGNTPYRQDENYFGNVMHDFTSQVRVGFEYAYMVTTYTDEQKTHNNRYQLSTFYMF